MITVKKTTTNWTSYHLYISDNYMGDVILNQDNTHHFPPVNDNFIWSANKLKMLANKLNELDIELEKNIIKEK